MARTKVVPQIATRAGLTAAAISTDASNGNYAAPFTGYEIFIFANSGASDYTVTFYGQSADPRGNKTNLVLTVSHTTNSTMATGLIVGPFNYADWYDSATGGIDFTVSNTAITVLIITNPWYNPASSTGG